MEQLKFSELPGKQLYEQTNYGIEFDLPLSLNKDRYKGILSMVSQNAGILNLGNYIGSFDFYGTVISVKSKKISSEEYDGMLMEIAANMATLPFSFNTPAFEMVEHDLSISTTIPYHTFLLLKHIVLNPESNFAGAYGYIFSRPCRKIMKEPFECYTWEASNIGFDTLREIMTKPYNLYGLEATNRLCGTTVSQKLRSNRACNMFPETVTCIKTINSLDTPENRFIKYFLSFCSSLINSFERKLSGTEVVNISWILDDLKIMTEIIESLAKHPILEEVGNISTVPFNSTIMQKRNGYKDILKFYMLLQGSIRLPFFEDKIQLVIENKDIAELYEIWAFFRLISIVRDIAGVMPEKAEIFAEDAFKSYLRQSVNIEFNINGRKISIWYNRTFGNRKGSYSLPLRPDIVIETEYGRYIFDAKFKLGDVTWDNPEEEKSFTYKNADIYKMHTYKDAIDNVRLACILYPNPDPNRGEIFWQDEAEGTGVGAFPLLPGRESEKLKNVISRILFKHK